MKSSNLQILSLATMVAVIIVVIGIPYQVFAWNQPPPPQPCEVPSKIVSNFNGTPIAGGNYVWFNSILKLKSPVPSTGLTLLFTGQSISSSQFTLSVPDAKVIFSPTATTATTVFDTVNNMWITTVPASFGDNVFLSGLAFKVPAGGLPGGINLVTWSGSFSSSSPANLQWQFGAAVYNSFTSSNYNSLGVKPTHSNTLDSYLNGDQAGTPENFKGYVTGGARGGGGSNWTGSYSATASASLSCQPLAIKIQDKSGKDITGLFTLLYSQNGKQLLTWGFSPTTFYLSPGTSYQVQVQNFGNCSFDHWADTGSTINTRDVSITSTTTLTAIYACT